MTQNHMHTTPKAPPAPHSSHLEIPTDATPNSDGRRRRLRLGKKLVFVAFPRKIQRKTHEPPPCFPCGFSQSRRNLFTSTNETKTRKRRNPSPLFWIPHFRLLPRTSIPAPRQSAPVRRLTAASASTNLPQATAMARDRIREKRRHDGREGAGAYLRRARRKRRPRRRRSQLPQRSSQASGDSSPPWKQQPAYPPDSRTRRESGSRR